MDLNVVVGVAMMLLTAGGGRAQEDIELSVLEMTRDLQKLLNVHHR